MTAACDRAFAFFFAPGRAAGTLAALSLAALAFVLVLQYGFGVEPCVLCLWQRAPWSAAALAALLAAFWRPYGRRTAFLLLFCAACYLAGFGLGVFHSGVELHWWLGTSSCGVQPLAGTDPESLRDALAHTVVARCDQVTWRLFGLSLANLNIGASLALAFYAATAAAKALQHRHG